MDAQQPRTLPMEIRKYFFNLFLLQSRT